MTYKVWLNWTTPPSVAQMDKLFTAVLGSFRGGGGRRKQGGKEEVEKWVSVVGRKRMEESISSKQTNMIDG